MSSLPPFIRATRTGAMVAFAGFLTLPLLTGALPIAAQEPGPAISQPPAAHAPQLERFEYWRARRDEAIERVDAARKALDEVNAAVSRMQRRNHPRGAARQKLREEQARAREAYAAARHHLEVELPAEARSQGAPRQWVAAPS